MVASVIEANSAVITLLVHIMVTQVSCFTRMKGDSGTLGNVSLDSGSSYEDKVLSRKKRSIHFPKGAKLTIANTFITPGFDKNNGDIKGVLTASLYVRYIFPDDIVIFGKRSIDSERMEAYEAVASLLDSFGQNGSACVRRLVCQVATPEGDAEGFGLYGEVLRMILTPSHNLDGARRSLLPFTAAEHCGRRHGGCEQTYAACPYDLEQVLHTGVALIRNTVASSLKWRTGELPQQR